MFHINDTIACLLAYLIGAIPFGLILSWIGGEGDVRKIGSGNIGATNVLRTGRKGLAFATLLLDAFKGALPVLLFATDPRLLITCAVLGHVLPIWLRFHGGKGVATSGGGLLIAMPYVGICVVVVWLTVARLSRVSAMGAIVGFGSAPLFALIFGSWGDAAFLFGLWFFLLLTHRDNLYRLFTKRELSFKARAKRIF